MPPNTILLKAENHAFSYDEARAAGAITPGMLLRRTATGTLLAHDDANGHAIPLVALENRIGGTISTAYASGDLVHFHKCQPGDELYMILVSGENAFLGAFLSSDGTGKLQVTTGTNWAIFEAVEDVDASAADARIRVRALTPGAQAAVTTTSTTTTTTTTT